MSFSVCFLCYETLQGAAQLFKIKLIPKGVTSQTQFAFNSVFMKCRRSNWRREICRTNRENTCSDSVHI